VSQPLIVSVPHRLGRQEARRRLDGGIGRLQRELGVLLGWLDYHWQGDTLNFIASAMWQRISGRIEVLDDAVCVVIELPWVMHSFATPSQNVARARRRAARKAARRGVGTCLSCGDQPFDCAPHAHRCGIRRDLDEIGVPPTAGYRFERGTVRLTGPGTRRGAKSTSCAR
jgi:hypothetical protein